MGGTEKFYQGKKKYPDLCQDKSGVISFWVRARLGRQVGGWS